MCSHRTIRRDQPPSHRGIATLSPMPFLLVYLHEQLAPQRELGLRTRKVLYEGIRTFTLRFLHCVQPRLDFFVPSWVIFPIKSAVCREYGSFPVPSGGRCLSLSPAGTAPLLGSELGLDPGPGGDLRLRMEYGESPQLFGWTVQLEKYKHDTAGLQPGQKKRPQDYLRFAERWKCPRA